MTVNLDWQEVAACRQSVRKGQLSADAWHETLGRGRSNYYNPMAVAICKTCPVKFDCLEAALSFPEEYGLWGGMTPSERAEEAERREQEAKQKRGQN